MISEIKKITDIPVAVLTNSSTIIDKTVFNDLLKADLVMPSIDSLLSKTIKVINKPLAKFDMNKIVDGLAQFSKEYSGKLWLEILICKGINDSENDFAKFKDVVDKINPDATLINTVARPSMSGDVLPISKYKIDELKELIGETAIDIKQYSNDLVKNDISYSNSSSKEALVYSLLKIRSCHFDEICSSVSISSEQLTEVLERLKDESKIITNSFDNLIYYKIQEKR